MHEGSIELPNKAVADELPAVHQYVCFHLHCDDQSYDLLAGLFHRYAASRRNEQVGRSASKRRRRRVP